MNTENKWIHTISEFTWRHYHNMNSSNGWIHMMPGQNMKHRKLQRKGQKGHTTWESTPSADPIVNSFYGPMNEDKIMNEN